MGFTVTIHKCALPDTTETRLRLHYTIGTVWMCDECGLYYALESHYDTFYLGFEIVWSWILLPPPEGPVHTGEEVRLAMYHDHQERMDYKRKLLETRENSK